MDQLVGKTNDAPETASGAPPPVRPRADGRSIPATDERRRVLHPRDLACPRCGAGVDSPCSFSGRVQRELHCTERLLALGNPDLRVQPRSGLPAQQPNPQKTRPAPDAPGMALPAFILAPNPHPEDRDFHRSEGEDYYPENHSADVKADISGGLHELLFNRGRWKPS